MSQVADLETQPRHFIQAWRKHRGYSQEQLAQKAGLTQPTISRLERFTTDFTGQTLEAVARALRTTPGELLICDPELPHPVRFIPHTDPQLSQPGGEVDGQAGAGEHVSADDDLVEAGEPETGEIYVSAKSWKGDADAEDKAEDWLATCFDNLSSAERRDSESLGKPEADSGAGRTGIDEGKPPEGITAGRDIDLERRSMLPQIIDLLTDRDLGPGGFFIVCHRGGPE
jgi:transcriptional regulator with XRE-family HTH domain